MTRQPSRPELLSARRALSQRLDEIDAVLDREVGVRTFFTDDVCRAALLAIRELARRKRQTVTLDEIGAFCTLSADQRLLQQIIVALLEDAVHATDEGGEIGLSAVVDARHGIVRFSVWDTSPKEDDDPASRARFSLVDRLVAAQHGEVTITREASAGRCVAVTLPATVTTPACSRATLVVAHPPLG